MIKLIDIQPQGLSLSTPQAWRSWINDLTEWQHDLLHNHRPEGGEIYRFPLVQYHARGFRGLQAGASLLLKLLPLLEAEADLEISTLKHEINMLSRPKIYNLNRWQPFNANNYTIWNEKRALADRVQLLESILVANILGFCREVGFEIPNKSLQVRLVDALEDLGFQRFSTLNAELYRKTFNICFECNIDLPENIGIGRGSSKGFGRLYLENQKIKNPHKILL